MVTNRTRIKNQPDPHHHAIFGLFEDIPMRKAAFLVLNFVGILVLLSGLLFFLQGTGIFPYPKSSFMINETIWIVRGAILFVLGLVILWIGRRYLK
ncbi:hypothetical protein [Acidithiobacillus marinus]|nr:hypothetical protein [Acidithiobacillus marinus]